MKMKNIGLRRKVPWLQPFEPPLIISFIHSIIHPFVRPFVHSFVTFIYIVLPVLFILIHHGLVMSAVLDAPNRKCGNAALRCAGTMQTNQLTQPINACRSPVSKTKQNYVGSRLVSPWTEATFAHWNFIWNRFMSRFFRSNQKRVEFCPTSELHCKPFPNSQKLKETINSIDQYHWNFLPCSTIVLLMF